MATKKKPAEFTVTSSRLVLAGQARDEGDVVTEAELQGCNIEALIRAGHLKKGS